LFKGKILKQLVNKYKNKSKKRKRRKKEEIKRKRKTTYEKTITQSYRKLSKAL
jgi:hypothetical protein